MSIPEVKKQTSTPIKKKTGSNKHHSSLLPPAPTKVPHFKKVRAQMARDIEGEVTDAIPFSQFLQRYLPRTPAAAEGEEESEHYFLGMRTRALEKTWEGWKAMSGEEVDVGVKDSDEQMEDVEGTDDEEEDDEGIDNEEEDDEGTDDEEEDGEEAAVANAMDQSVGSDGNSDEGARARKGRGESVIQASEGETEDSGLESVVEGAASDEEQSPVGQQPGTPSYSYSPYEFDLCDDIINLIQPFMTSFIVKNSSNKSDKNSKRGENWRPDISLYAEDDVDEESLIKYPNQLDRAQLLIEVKGSGEASPFGDKRSFKPSEKGHEIRGQLVSYLTNVMNRQHRTHVFIVILCDPFFQVVRVDRAGLIVSERINMRSNARPVIEFFRRFNALPGRDRGMDETVQWATPAQTDLAKKHLSHWKSDKGLERPVFAIEVPMHEDPKKSRVVLAWVPILDAGSLTGRCTRAWAVWDVEDEKVRFLKDTWRSCAPGMEKESDLIHELHAYEVPHIPVLIAGNDVPGLNQATETQRHLTDIDQRVHHRLLEDFIPTCIEDAKTPLAMMTAIFHAFEAHKAAYEYGILHRDISDNNVMIDANGDGVLTDWELAVRFKTRDGKPISLKARQGHRTGTWYFMSQALLNEHDKLHSLGDDLESFLWLVLFLAISRLDFNHPANHTHSHIINSLFGHATWDASTKRYFGGAEKHRLITSHSTSGKKLRFPKNGALQDWYDSTVSRLHNDMLQETDCEESEKSQQARQMAIYDAFVLAIQSEAEWTPAFYATEKNPLKRFRTKKKKRPNAGDADYEPAGRGSAKKQKQSGGSARTRSQTAAAPSEKLWSSTSGKSNKRIDSSSWIRSRTSGARPGSSKQGSRG